MNADEVDLAVIVDVHVIDSCGRIIDGFLECGRVRDLPGLDQSDHGVECKRAGIEGVARCRNARLSCGRTIDNARVVVVATADQTYEEERKTNKH